MYCLQTFLTGQYLCWPKVVQCANQDPFGCVSVLALVVVVSQPHQVQAAECGVTTKKKSKWLTHPEEHKHHHEDNITKRIRYYCAMLSKIQTFGMPLFRCHARMRDTIDVWAANFQPHIGTHANDAAASAVRDLILRYILVSCMRWVGRPAWTMIGLFVLLGPRYLAQRHYLGVRTPM